MKIDSTNTGIVKQYDLPKDNILGRNNKIIIQGIGCLLVQSTTYYNIKKAAEDPNLSLTFDKKTNSYCVQMLNNALETSMAIVEVGLNTGQTANEESLDKLLDPQTPVEDIGILRYEIDNDKVQVYFDKFDSIKRCFSFEINAEKGISVENMQKRTVIAYDYYDSEVRKSITI